MLKRVCFVGLGYIGLPTAVLAANNNTKVHGVDISDDIVDKTNKGLSHINEPGLEELLLNAVSSGNLHASKEYSKADIFIIAVPTPITQDKKADISIVKAVATKIAKYLEKGNLVIVESTCPVGTTEKVMQIISEVRQDLNISLDEDNTDVYLAYCPERIIPGKTLYELKNNSRIIGGINKQSANLAKEFYSAFCTAELHTTNAKTAEMAKLSENAYRGVNIAFANELSMICDEEGINTNELIELTNLHPRVDILNPGIGVGGHCIPVDPWFLVERYSRKASLVSESLKININKTSFIKNKINNLIQDFGIEEVYFLGVSYKEETGDCRESPALEILRTIKCKTIKVIEPNLSKLPEPLCYMDHITLHPMNNKITQGSFLIKLINHSVLINLYNDFKGNKYDAVSNFFSKKVDSIHTVS